MPKFLAVPSLVEPDLILPIIGQDGVERDYTIKAANAEQFITLQAVTIEQQGGTVRGADKERLEGVTDLEMLWALTLGRDTMRAMLADGVSAADFQRASRTAYQWHVTGGDEAAAELVWSGKAQTPASGTTPSAKDGDAADTTNTPASTPGTTTPRATKQPKRQPSSAGPTSGSTST